MSIVHARRGLRRYLPGKPDADTAFWLTVCGTAWVLGPVLAALTVQVVSH